MRSVLFTMSLAGTLTVLCCVLFFRLFGRSLKAKWRRVLLAIALAFYLVPFPQYKFVLLRACWALHILPDTSALFPDAWPQENNPYLVLVNAVGQSFYSEAQTILILISGVLLTVSAAILLYQAVKCLRVKRHIQIRGQPAEAEEIALLEELKACVGLRRRIRLARSERVSVPVVFGVLSPVILLPGDKRTGARALKSMLLHELAHIKHQDILLQWAGLLAVALHWYNPFSYLLLHLLTQANEQYSDAKAVQKLDEQEKRRYCEDLIDSSERAGMGDGSLMVLGFSKNAKQQIRGRIEEVLNHSRRRPGIALCAGVLVLLLGTAAAFVYCPPQTVHITDSSSDWSVMEKLLNQEIDLYFGRWDDELDGKSVQLNPLP